MGCESCAWGCFFCCIILAIAVGIPLLIVFNNRGAGDPVLTVEGASVKAYNLTSDNRLFCIFDISIRAHNLDPKYPLTYEGLDLEVRKGLHHKLADDAIAPFRQAAGEETVVAVEAVGMYVQLEEKIAAEMRADRVAGSTAVNIFFSSWKGGDISCGNVKLNFQGGEFVKVGCDVLHSPSTDDGA